MSNLFPIAADIAVEPRSLQPLQRLSLFENILQLNHGDLLEPSHCLLAWTYVLLLELPWLPPEAVNLIIRRSRERLLAIGAEIVEAPETRPTYTMAFVERNFVVWHGETRYLDLRDGTSTPKVPVTPLESIAYNLGELFRRNAARCRDAIYRNTAAP